ncbi:MAG: hypothetical protein J0H29_24430, partial [Sphingobacteriales bacterium]|nr:hypothetical protein [Sphingobacteriales bacterium]
KISFEKSLKYMGFEPGQKLAGKPIDYVFLGSCTNGRIEDFRLFTQYVKGKKKVGNVTAWLVPGSWQVRRQIEADIAMNGLAGIVVCELPFVCKVDIVIFAGYCKNSFECMGGLFPEPAGEGSGFHNIYRMHISRQMLKPGTQVFL